jgi:hypothetical protein
MKRIKNIRIMVKISYLDLINNFWNLHEELNFSTNEMGLYFGLLNIANRLRWKDTFSKTNDYLCVTIGINEKVLINGRNKLKQRGLIDFVSGKSKRVPTRYVIIGCENDTQNSSQTDTQNSSQTDTQNDTRQGKKSADNIRHKEEDKEKDKDFFKKSNKKNFEKNFNSLPTEKNEELEELEFLRKKIFELENQKTTLNNEEQPKKEKKVAAKKEKSSEILFSESDVAEFSEFENRFIGTDYEHFDLKFYFEAVSNWSLSKGAKKVDWIATARNFMIGDTRDGKGKMKNIKQEFKNENINIDPKSLLRGGNNYNKN